MEHQDYLEAVRELTDWLMSAGKELQHWSDTSGDSASIGKKLSEVKVMIKNYFSISTATAILFFVKLLEKNE